MSRETPDLRFEPGAGGVKQELILRTPHAPRSFGFHLSDPEGLLGDVTETGDGGYEFSGDIGDGIRLHLLPAMAYERPASPNHDPRPAPGSAHLSVTKAGDGWDIVEWVDEEWLRGKKFPIVLDPYLYYSGSGQTDCYIVSDNYSTQNNCGAGAVIAGHGPGGEPLGSCGTGTPKWCIQRGLLDFNVNDLPRGSDVTAARLKMWQFNNQTGEGFYVGLYNNDTPFNSMATWERPALGQTWNGGDSGSYQDESWINANNTDQYRFWYLGLHNIVETWRNTGVNGGLMLRARPEPRSQIEPDTGHVVGFHSNTVADSAKWPEFRVTYTPPPAPTVDKTVAPAAGYTLSPNGHFARNTVATYTVRMTSSVTQDDVKLTDVFPAGVKVLSSTLKLDGATCGGCTISSTTITKTGIDFVAGQTHTLTYNALLTGVDERGCSNLVNTATTTGLGGGTNSGNTASDALTAVVCDVGLGIEPWWSYVTRPVSAAGDVKVNVANGNAVVTQVDGTPIQGRGDLAFGLRRTYNSQDARVVDLPGGLPKGWQLNFGELSDSFGSSPSGLVVPPLTTLAKSLPIVLVDRDGTRHTFTSRGTSGLSSKVLKVEDLTQPPADWKLVPETGVATTLVPKALAKAVDTATSNYTAVCVDASYAAPDGVQMGLWRYIALDDRGATTPCTSGPDAKAGPRLLGFATVRTDRFRNEFTWDGKLLSQMDATGNEFRYLYGATLPLAGVATGSLTRVFDASECTEADAVAAGSKCRSFTMAYDTSSNLASITDPAGRTTTYHYTSTTGGTRLTKVVNPDQTFVGYTYADTDPTCAAPNQVALAGQLCTIRDERDVVTALRYNTSPAGKIGPVASLTDRWGTTTTFTYVNNAQTDVLTNNVQKRSFTSIDALGRVGQVTDSDATATYHQTNFTWDSASCRKPSGGTDNNLCRVVRKAFNDTQTGVANGVTTLNSDTTFTYNDEAQLLSESRTDGTTTLVTTYGYETQFVQPGTRTKVSDTVGAGGTHTLGSRTAATAVDLLYTISDRTQSLTPRGNTATSTDMPKYLTTYHVDNNKDVSPNSAPAAPAAPGHREPVICTSADPATDIANTGLVCVVDAPAFDGVNRTKTKYEYDHFGAKRRMTAPSGVHGPVPSGANAYTEYTYYDNGTTDLSGQSSAAGWLKAVTDPYQKFVVFGYDRAGNVARTWDRNSTSDGGYASPDAHPVGTTSGYAQELRGSLSNPWRYVTESSDALGNRTTYVVDAAGHQLNIRPPRGNLAATDTSTTADDDDFDTVQEFNAAGAVTKRITPNGRAAGGKAWRWRYDAYGNQISESDALAHPDFPALRSDDPDGHTKVVTYDGANRLTSVRWTRTPDSTQAAPGCDVLAGGAPLSSTRYYCETTFAYDGIDNQVASSDANKQRTRVYFDAFGREYARDVPRSGTAVMLRSEKRYDADGNVTLACSPREFDAAEHVGESGWSVSTACTTTGRFSTVYTYDVAGRQATNTVPRDAATLTTSTTYSPDGHVASETAPNGGVTTYSNDLNGRRSAVTVPRASGVSHTTTFTFDASGNTTSVTKPGSPAPRVTAFEYDEVHRLVETVEGSSSTDADLAGATSADGGSNIHSGVRYDADGNVIAKIDPRAYRDGTGAPSATPPGAMSQTPFMTRFDVDAEGRTVAEYRPRYDNSAAHGDNPATSEQRTQCTTTKRPAVPWGARDLPSYTEQTAVCAASTTYDAVGNVVRADLPTQDTAGNRYVTYSYTDDNLLSAVVAPDPAAASGTSRVAVQSTVYDGAGRVLTVTGTAPSAGANRYVTAYAYSSDGLVLEQTDGITARKTTFTYDHNGNKRSATVNTSDKTEWTYFSDDQVKTMKDPLNAVTTYGYDANGNPSEVVPPNLQGTSLKRLSTYTLDNLLLEATVPVTSGGEQRRTAYTYDGGGRQLSVVNERLNSSGAVVESGGTMHFEHFPSDRPSTQRGRETVDRTTITKTYDAAGHPATVTNTPASGTAVTTTMTYYLDGLPRSVTQGGRTVSYTYDGAGALALRDVSDGTTEVTRYAHGNSGQITTVTSDRLNGAVQIALVYDSAGRLTSQTNPDGTVATRTFRDDNALATQVLAKNGTAIASWRYGYHDPTGRLTLAARDASASAACPALKTDTTLPAAGVHCFYYDAAGRLDHFKEPTANRALAHDANGNRTAYGTSTFSYNLDDTLATANGTAHDYDGAGRLESDGTTWYCYDGLDRTRDVRVGGSSCTGSVANGVSYAYDGFDRQVTRTETGASAVDAGTTSLFYDGTASTLLAETRPNAVEVDYLPLNGRPVHVEQAGGTAVEQFLTDDGRGNISTATTADTGALACSLRYDPYGTPMAAQSGANPCSTGSTPSSVLFAGERRDAVSGNYQLGSRTYDPGKAAFLSEDVYRGAGSAAAESVGTDPLTMNRYAYVNGDPVNYIDPTGHAAECPDDAKCAGRTARIARRQHEGRLAERHRAEATKRLELAYVEILKALRGIDPQLVTELESLIGNLTYAPQWSGDDSIREDPWGQAALDTIFTAGVMGIVNGARAGLRAAFGRKVAVTPEKTVLDEALRGLAARTGDDVTSGIYIVVAKSGDVYIGQSGNITRRLLQHVANGKIDKVRVALAERVSVLGGKLDRELAEQLVINSRRGGVDTLENIVNPIGPQRQHLLDAVNGLEDVVELLRTQGMM